VAEGLHGYKDPPRTTWFDELNATRPTQLDNVEVTSHDGVRAALRATGRIPVARPER
jgi:hypothetical protein